MENHSDRIQEYIDGLLVGEDLLQFQAQLIIDNDLRNMLILQREVYEILNCRVLNEEIEGRFSAQRISNNFRHETGGYLISFQKILKVICVLSVLVVSFMYLFF